MIYGNTLLSESVDDFRTQTIYNHKLVARILFIVPFIIYVFHTCELCYNEQATVNSLILPIYEFSTVIRFSENKNSEKCPFGETSGYQHGL